MPRATLIIGNGLGMALDPAYFSLDNAMDAAWNRRGRLSETQKEQIRLCVNVQGIEDRPHGEEHLDVLHVVGMACKLLNAIESPNVHWLSAEGGTFPLAIEKYITSVAWHYHHFRRVLPQRFVENLALFLQVTKSHVATLNYDNLLYQKLIELNILRGYFGPLVDGFYTTTGFNVDHLERKYNNSFGYYLHLHGSPLFIDYGDQIIKQRQGTVDESISTPHLVLTHVKHKRSVIANSNLLSAYWQYFEKGLNESNRIILFGYSGLDIHLNQVIAKYAPGKIIYIIEWDGAGTEIERIDYWRDKLQSDIHLNRLANILSFIDWKTL
jgi:hypothetical protein